MRSSYWHTHIAGYFPLAVLICALCGFCVASFAHSESLSGFGVEKDNSLYMQFLVQAAMFGTNKCVVYIHPLSCLALSVVEQ
jgi:hypothetical protein